MDDLSSDDLLTVMASEIHRIAKEEGHAPGRLPRSVFLAHSTLGKRYERLGTWSSVRARATGVPIPAAAGEPAQPAVDISALDFDDDPDTSPGVPLVAVPEGHYVKGVSTLVGADGATKIQWIKTDQEKKTQAEMLARLVEGFDGKIPAAAPTPVPTGSIDHLLALYPLGDPHLGLRNRNGYGLEKGAAMLIAAVEDLVQRGPRAKHAIVANMGDYLHSDDPSNMTRRSGNPLDVDGDWFEILKVGRDVMIHLVRCALRHHEQVHVKNLVGNHDDLCSLFMSLLIEQHFRDEPRVDVDVSGAPFQWYEFGQNLLCFSHGQSCKRKDIPAVMANRKREAWGRTSHAFCYLGHVHHTRKSEEGGVMIESVRTLAEQDLWHEAAGYVSGRGLLRIALHIDGGEVGREQVSAAMLERMMAA